MAEYMVEVLDAVKKFKETVALNHVTVRFETGKIHGIIGRNEEGLSMTHKERKQQWEARIEAYKSSGLSKKEFCKQHNISVRQLYYWLKKESIKEEQARNTIQWLQVNLNNQEDKSDNNFLKVKVGPAVIEVRQGFNEKLLLDIVKVLSTLC
jgi:ABC-type polysaccharide/polyol phosphate transport system ATPase subunit